MASKSRKDTKPNQPFGEISKDNPRTLERVSDGAVTRVTDPLEYMSLTTAYGYKDITSGSGSRKSSGGSSNTGTGSGGTASPDNTTSK
jgi:hypothetical protein